MEGEFKFCSEESALVIYTYSSLNFFFFYKNHINCACSIKTIKIGSI